MGARVPGTRKKIMYLQIRFLFLSRDLDLNVIPKDPRHFVPLNSVTAVLKRKLAVAVGERNRFTKIKFEVPEFAHVIAQ